MIHRRKKKKGQKKKGRIKTRQPKRISRRRIRM